MKISENNPHDTVTLPQHRLTDENFKNYREIGVF